MQSGPELRQSLGSVHGHVDLPAPPRKARFERGPHARIIVGNEQPFHEPGPIEHAAVPDGASASLTSELAGRMQWKVAPCPNRLSTKIVPPCCSRMRRQTASPSPELPGRVLNP